MADPVNPFAPEELEKYKKFFQPQARPNVLGTPEGLAAVEAERAGLASFLGSTDYGKQLEEAQNLSKLQLALALAQRGFAAAGATPQRGEAPISTLSRELFAPVAGDAGAVAANLMKQKQALQAAERQEERQLKLSALQNVQQREQKAFEDDATATERARQFMQNILKKGDTVSNDYLVDGKNVPLIVRKDYTGKVEGFYNLDGGKIENAKVKIYRKPDAASKPITSWAKDVQVKGPDGNWVDAPDALRIADATGQNSRVVIGSTVLDFNEKSPNYNARIVAKKGSGTSAYYSPTSRSVYLNKSAIELFNLDPSLEGQEAVFRQYAIKPDMAGPNSRPAKELVVGGKSFFFDQHSGYNPETGDITVQRGGDAPPVTFRAEDLFRLENPKAFTGAGQITVPSDPELLGKINRIPGLEGVTAGDSLDIERNEQGQTQVRRGQAVITLTDDQNALFQTRALSPVEKVEAGQVLEPRQLYVNTSDRPLTVGGQTIGPGQTGAFSKTDINTNAFLNVSGSFREVGPVSTDTKTYMVIGVEPRTIDGVQYAPGDEARFSPQEFNNLPDAVKKFFTEDRELRSAQVKKNYFKALWKDVTQRERGNLTPRDITEQDLETLLGMFPAGMRSGGKNLRSEIFAMIKFGANANQDSGATPSSAAASAAAQSYADSVRAQLSSAKTRYDRFVARGALAQVPWDSLSFERKRAFADLPKTIQLSNIADAWQKSEDRLAKDKAAIAPVKPEDAAAFSSAIELLILAKQLRDGQEVDKTGKFTGFLGSLGANTFADVTPLTSGGSQRLQQIINRMKASYATLSEVEGGGRDSVFRQQLQAELIPSFPKPEKLNRDNLNSLINRLETNIRSTFNQEIQTSNVVPKTFEIMAKEAGITGVSVNQKRYRWLDPNFQETPPVTRQRVMDGINMKPFEFTDAQDLRTGRLLPPIPGMPDRRYVKIKTLDNGEVVIQEAGRDGRPNPQSPKLILGDDMRTRVQ